MIPLHTEAKQRTCCCRISSPAFSIRFGRVPFCSQHPIKKDLRSTAMRSLLNRSWMCPSTLTLKNRNVFSKYDWGVLLIQRITKLCENSSTVLRQFSSTQDYKGNIAGHLFFDFPRITKAMQSSAFYSSLEKSEKGNVKRVISFGQKAGSFTTDEETN